MSFNKMAFLLNIKVKVEDRGEVPGFKEIFKKKIEF